jgi:crotonobetainyl-CoA:carnitine CoA-transferase CaiB-like acyl-CoA transferase
VAHARQTGEPVHLDVAQIDAMAPVMAPVYAGPLNPDDHVPSTIDPSSLSWVSGSWLSGIFPTLGHDAWVAVDIEDGEDWALLCRFLERDDLIASDLGRARLLATELHEVVGHWLSRQTAFTAMHLLQRAGLAPGVVQSGEDVWRDPQLNARQFQERVYQVDLGAVTYPRSAQLWTKTPGVIPVPPARLGGHTYEVLRQWIGLSETDMQSLSSSGAILDADETENLSGSDASLP